MSDRTYIAKGPHKRPCDLCGVVVLPGDRMVMWCWPGENDPTEGNIIRCHESCAVIYRREGIEYFGLGEAFADSFDPALSTPLKEEAAKALAEARAAPKDPA